MHPPTSASAVCACRYESFIFIVPPAVAPLLGAVYVRRFGRRSGIMLGCVIIIIGQVRRHQDVLCCALLRRVMTCFCQSGPLRTQPGKETVQ